MERKTSLRYYKYKTKPGWEGFYDRGWESKLYFKARSESLELNGRVGSWMGRVLWCEKCSNEYDPIIETLETLSECEIYREERNELEGRIIELIGEEE